ncbi:hypothetical protein JTE90_025699 [Oedothorax gibbosus]|uniref:Uncharacterized protein n=1 Tax=Oedothorax gibbosus TaxID=931172 RepID=A0AAV6TM34_9ARAC|nr:hypothetical protein JTE90_025699 [Oedothorax gibbosus]
MFVTNIPSWLSQWIHYAYFARYWNQHRCCVPNRITPEMLTGEKILGFKQPLGRISSLLPLAIESGAEGRDWTRHYKAAVVPCPLDKEVSGWEPKKQPLGWENEE